MRQPRDELADGLHLAGLQQRRLRHLAFRRLGQQPIIRLGQLAGALGNALFKVVVEVAQRRLGALFLRDVAGDLRRADDAARPVAHRRDRQRHIDLDAILAPPYRLEMIDPLAMPDPVED